MSASLAHKYRDPDDYLGETTADVLEYGIVIPKSNAQYKISREPSTNEVGQLPLLDDTAQNASSRTEMTSEHNTSGINSERIESKYFYKDRVAVQWFLIQHSSLGVLLDEAYPIIKMHFPESQLVLEVVSDREEATPDQLLLSIRINIEPEQGYELLKQFDEDWWIDRSREYSEVCIDIELY
jgi:hypothetical protein